MQSTNDQFSVDVGSRNSVSGSSTSPPDPATGHSDASIAMKKRKLTLDLTGGSSEANGKGLLGFSPKKASLLSPSLPGLSPGNFLLASPDLQMLKISSPELERLIIQNLMSGGMTPTPSASTSKTFGDEHDAHLDAGYVKGYCDAFKAVQQSAMSPFAPLNLNMAPLSMSLGIGDGTMGNFSTLPLQIVSLPHPPPAHNGQNPQTRKFRYF